MYNDPKSHLKNRNEEGARKINQRANGPNIATGILSQPLILLYQVVHQAASEFPLFPQLF